MKIPTNQLLYLSDLVLTLAVFQPTSRNQRDLSACVPERITTVPIQVTHHKVFVTNKPQELLLPT
jgi:hypothetical protein